MIWVLFVCLARPGCTDLRRLEAGSWDRGSAAGRKHPDVRRAELLERATELFVRHGYENVDLNDLIAEQGSPKEPSTTGFHRKMR